MSPNPPAGSFSGELGVVGLFDLGQLLMLNRATGCLMVHRSVKRGFLYFAEGRLVNAVDDAGAQGETAAYQIFSWRTGAFQFRPEPVSGMATIQNGTEAVMLEAARRIDESAPAAGGTPGTSATRLSERQASLLALRDVFKQVAIEAAPRGSDAAPSPALYLYELARSGDRLVFRSGQPPRLRQAEAWREAADPPLSPEDYTRIRAYLLEACQPAGTTGAAEPSPSRAPAAAPTTRTFRLADGRSIALDILGVGDDEALWLRPIGLEPPDPATLRGSLERLEQVLGLSHGVVLVGGPTLDSARMMLHAVIEVVAADATESLLIASADRTYEHRDRLGLVMRVEPQALRDTLRTAQPDILALDPALGRGVVLDDLEQVSRVLAATVVPDPALLVARWLLRIGHGDLERAQISLANTSIGLVMAYPGALGDDTLAFNAWILSERERALALRGEASTLSPILQQATARVRQERRRRAA